MVSRKTQIRTTEETVMAKASKTAEFVHEASGRTVSRETLEDPENLGFLRRGVALRPIEFQAAQFFGLRNPKSGNTLDFQHTSVDPTRATREDVPQQLKSELAEAEEQSAKANDLAINAGRELDKVE